MRGPTSRKKPGEQNSPGFLSESDVSQTTMKLLCPAMYPGIAGVNARSFHPRRTLSVNVLCEIVSVRGFCRSVTRATRRSRVVAPRPMTRLIVARLPANDCAATTTIWKRRAPTFRSDTRGRTETVCVVLSAPRELAA